jgi:TPR repeat protein
MLYSSGRGVPRDVVQAVMWADLAAAAGEPNSPKLLASLEKTARPDQIAEAIQKEHEWKPSVQYSWSIK